MKISLHDSFSYLYWREHPLMDKGLLASERVSDFERMSEIIDLIRWLAVLVLALVILLNKLRR